MIELYQTESEIKAWLDQHGVKNYDVYQGIENDELIWFVDVNGEADLRHKNLTHIPVQFNYVFNGFYCSNNQLTSLKGCPRHVNGGFSCDNNKLVNLKHCPHFVTGGFICSDNDLNTIEFLPQSVGGLFLCPNNPKLGVWQEQMIFQKFLDESLRIKKIIDLKDNISQKLKKTIKKDIVKSKNKKI